MRHGAERGAGFSHEDARRFYDRFGARQDGQGFYENAALDALADHGAFSQAEAVLEIGCGTGKFAARLLSDHLPVTARYVGLDISETMVGLARHRIRPWAGRAEVHPSDGGFDLSGLGVAFDRIICTYVFDLLGERDIARALAAANAAAGPGGLLCAAGLTRGTGPFSRLTSALWAAVHARKPALVGGCRPLVLADHLDEAHWRVAHHQVVVRMTVPSEVLVAEAL